jgi:amino-acid N-acetyltransferase
MRSPTTLRPLEYSIRPAVRAEAAAIRWMVWRAGINPASLNWKRFVVAVTPSGEIIACGQVKSHGDGTRELASIVTRPAYRGQGVASAVIRHLTAAQPPPLYLTCRRSLEPFYERFGFEGLKEGDLPPYFRKLWRLVNSLPVRLGQAPPMSVMRWDSPL